MPHYLDTLSRFVADATFDSLPSGAVDAARDVTLDTLGAIAAGMMEPDGERRCGEQRRHERKPQHYARSDPSVANAARLAASSQNRVYQRNSSPVRTRLALDMTLAELIDFQILRR